MLKKILSITCAVALSFSCMLPVFAKTDSDEIKVRSIEMADTMIVRVGQTRLINAYILPVSADDQEIVWSSSNDEVAAIWEDGEIAGISPGTAIITASTSNNKSASCVVTVPGTALVRMETDFTTADLNTADGGVQVFSSELGAALEKALAATAIGQTAVVSYTDKTQLSSAALRLAAYATSQKNKAASIRFNTTGENGDILAQLHINPALGANSRNDIYTQIYTTGVEVAAVQSSFEKYYRNKLFAIYCTHTGEYGMMVEIAAKLNLQDMNTQNLHFYSYDHAANSYSLLQNTGYRLDSAGYLHFNTTCGGYIIISDGALTK